ncbi:MAG: NADH-quinone oxidoreductase subunit M [Planctomycetes bacterium]|nr:NADH-quinone oxidoreductase subunit M [Planctomycetota bacterium]
MSWLTNHILTWIIFLPTLGAVLCLLAPKARARPIAMVFTFLTLLLAVSLFKDYFPQGVAPDEVQQTIFGSSYGSEDSLRHVERAEWITGDKFKIEYYLGMDGLSFPLVILTGLIGFLACWGSHTIKKAEKGYYILFLLLETGMLGVFLALDFFLFYVFWEVMLLPMYFLIGVWGGPRKEYAAIKFFLFTLAGSVLMLVAIVACYFFSGKALDGNGTFDIIAMSTNTAIQSVFNDPNTTLLGYRFGGVMFLFFAIGFAIKVPTFPFHTWLPDAHVEAPTPISMILAGVLLKMGAYGFFRIAYPLFPAVAHDWAFYVALIGVISIIYGALCAMAQTDFKKLVAYSSISHMGYVMLGIAVMNKTGFQGAMFQVLAHGISSPMCFYLVGVIYERAHHRDINRFGGLWLTMPKYGSLATLGFFASLGLPALCGFIGEFYVVLGTFSAQDKFPWAVPMAILAALGAILTAGYILWMIQRVYLGPAKEEYKNFPQATRTELGILVPLGVLCIALGVLPKHTVFNFMNGTLDMLVDHVAAAGALAQEVATGGGM